MKMRWHHQPRFAGRASGFSLVEILAAVAVLSILALLIIQITNATSRSVRLSNRTADASLQSRQAFDRIGADLSALVIRPDVDFYARDPATAAANAGYQNDDGATLLLMLSSVTSATSSTHAISGQNRGVSLVAYQINAHPDNSGKACLVRAGVPIGSLRPTSWGARSFMGLNSGGLPVKFNSTDTDFVSELLPVGPTADKANDYDVVAGGVIRMVIGFQLYPDNKPITFKDGTTSNNARGQVVYSPPVHGWSTNPNNDYIDLTRISAIVVGLVVIDMENMRLLTPSQVSTLASKFPVPTATTGSFAPLPVEAWTPISNSVDSLGQDIPLPARQSIRVYQRFYPITPYKGKRS